MEGKVEVKYFSFEQGEGQDIIVARFAREAINYYFNSYYDDLQIEDMAEEGITIQQLTKEEVNEIREIYDEQEGKHIKTSLKELAKESIKRGHIPNILICPVI